MLGILLFASVVAGCAERTPSEDVGTGVQVSPGATPTSAVTGPQPGFVVEDLAIRAADGRERVLHEDDGNATIRYTVRLPADAPKAGNAFVTFLLNGQVLDAENLRLEPGGSKSYTRVVPSVRDFDSLKAEVRAGPSHAVAETPVLKWPRMGEELAFGPLVIRLDEAFVSTAPREVTVNVSVNHAGPAEPIRDFRVKMLCMDGQGDVYPTNSARATLPAFGENVTVAVKLQDCVVDYYGLEFKADGDAGKTFYGRILLVAKDWKPDRP